MPTPTTNALKTLLNTIAFWLSWIFLTRAVAFFIPAVNSHMQGLVTGVIGTFTGLLLYHLLYKHSNLPLPVIKQPPAYRLLLLFSLGFLTGAALFTIIIICLITIGHLELYNTAQQFSPMHLLYLAGIIQLAMMEEIAFRGKAFTYLQASFSFQTSQLIVATAFALYHISAHYTIATAFTGPFMWAFVFGFAVARSGSIAVSTGLHAALNILQVLMGMKGKAGAIWTLSLPAGYPQEMIKHAEHIGLTLQIIMGISALLAGAWWMRKRNR